MRTSSARRADMFPHCEALLLQTSMTKGTSSCLNAPSLTHHCCKFILRMITEIALLTSSCETGLRVGKTQGWKVVSIPVVGGPVVGGPVAGGPVVGESVVGGPVVGTPIEDAFVVGTAVGQGKSLQGCVWNLSPMQSEPLLIGGGLVQVRVLTCVPGPHEELHCPQTPHSVKLPSTEICTPKVFVIFCTRGCKTFVKSPLSSETDVSPAAGRRT